MSVLDLLKQPFYALLAAGGLAAAGGGAYYVLVPGEPASAPATASASAPAAATAPVGQNAAKAVNASDPIPNAIRIEMEVRGSSETRSTEFKCDFTLRQDQACVVPFADALLQRNAGNPARAFINVPLYVNPIVKENISWKDLTEGTSFNVAGTEYRIRAKASEG